MTFGESISTCFSKYATFSGRASRSEYWWWQLFTFLIGCIPLAGFIAIFVFFIPNLAVGVRRLHDTGRSGWNFLWAFLPIIGTIILLVFFLTDSESDNQYGPRPE